MKYLLILLIASCTASQPLYKSGHYTVTTIMKSGKETVVTFDKVRGSYTLPSDTIKVGDKVEMIKVTRL